MNFAKYAKFYIHAVVNMIISLESTTQNSIYFINCQILVKISCGLQPLNLQINPKTHL